VSGIEQFIILLLGAFTLMLAITLASEPWAYPERTPILALFVAVAALLWSGANTFFTVFWHPEHLEVYFRFRNPPEELDTSTLDLSYFFTNYGSKSYALEDVHLYEIWLKAAEPPSLLRSPASIAIAELSAPVGTVWLSCAARC
jgi:hypothetical protein